jgi:hypothetical protein
MLGGNVPTIPTIPRKRLVTVSRQQARTLAHSSSSRTIQCRDTHSAYPLRVVLTTLSQFSRVCGMGPGASSTRSTIPSLTEYGEKLWGLVKQQEAAENGINSLVLNLLRRQCASRTTQLADSRPGDTLNESHSPSLRIHLLSCSHVVYHG